MLAFLMWGAGLVGGIIVPSSFFLAGILLVAGILLIKVVGQWGHYGDPRIPIFLAGKPVLFTFLGCGLI